MGVIIYFVIFWFGEGDIALTHPYLRLAFGGIVPPYPRFARDRNLRVINTHINSQGSNCFQVSNQHAEAIVPDTPNAWSMCLRHREVDRACFSVDGGNMGKRCAILSLSLVPGVSRPRVGERLQQPPSACSESATTPEFSVFSSMCQQQHSCVSTWLTTWCLLELPLGHREAYMPMWEDVAHQMAHEDPKGKRNLVMGKFDCEQVCTCLVFVLRVSARAYTKGSTDVTSC